MMADELEGMVLRIRRFEERLQREFHAGNVPGLVHLQIGQEAVAAGVCAALRDGDQVTSTHRPHGHAVARGLPLTPIIAELLGRVDGLCRGWGGSMHLIDVDAGFLGANGIVGASAPLAVGAALSARQRGDGSLATAFFGDGALGQGSLYEAVNLAVIWRLPVVFVCEDNGYADATPAEYAVGGDRSRRLAAFGVPAEVVDGMDVHAVAEAASNAVQRARAGGGPSVLHCETYRYVGHAEGAYGYYPPDSARYRTDEELEAWRARDPVLRIVDPELEESLAIELDGAWRAAMASEVAA
jgi:TPP-dependent pyruvate/acetoin dehydrogenase alpha subunit